MVCVVFVLLKLSKKTRCFLEEKKGRDKTHFCLDASHIFKLSGGLPPLSKYIAVALSVDMMQRLMIKMRSNNDKKTINMGKEGSTKKIDFFRDIS